jgi:hypothetical protein
VERALSLSASKPGQGADDGRGVSELVAGTDKAGLEQARAELVARLSRRSDDYQATAALSLVNRALASVGWDNPYDWKHRRKP